MAIKIKDEYPGRVIGSSADYPQGSFKNESVPGLKDGTPLEIKWIDDIHGLLQRLLFQANVLPSGVKDTVPSSDYMNSLEKIFARWLLYIDSGSTNAYILDSVSASTISGYFDGLLAIFKPVNSNTTASTLKIESLSAKSLTYYDGTAIEPGALLAGKFAAAVYNSTDDRFELFGQQPASVGVLHNAKSGLVLSNSVADLDHDIVFNVGAARASNVPLNMGLLTPLVKKMDEAWAIGNNQGGLVGTLTASTWYHAFVIRNDTTGSIDAYFETSPTAANIPAGYTAYRRVGSVYTDIASNVGLFEAREQAGGSVEYTWKDRVNVYSVADVGSLLSITIPLRVPPDIEPLAAITGQLFHITEDAFLLIRSLAEADIAPFWSVGGGGIFSLAVITGGDVASSNFFVSADVAGQIAIRCNRTDPAVDIITRGWIDRCVD